MKSYIYRGEIVDKVTKLPVTGARVELRDLYRRADQPLALTVVDSQGAFRFELTDEFIQRMFGDGEAVGYFRVVNPSNALIASTEQTRRWALRSDSSGRIEVDASRTLATVSAASYAIEGLVVNSTGPVSGASVVVRWKEFRSNDILLTSGTLNTTTDSAGRFRVVATTGTIANPTFDVSASASSLTGSATIENARPSEFVEIVLGAPVNAVAPVRTTAHRIAEAIQEATEVTSSSGINAFASANVSAYVASRSGLSEREVTAYIDAVKLQTQLSTLNAVDLDALFAITAAGIPATKDGVFSHRLPMLRRIIERASASRRIRTHTSTEMTTIIANLRVQARAALRQAPVPGVVYRVGTLVDSVTTGTSTDQNNFLDLLLDHEGTNEAFWNGVNDSTSLSANAKTRFLTAMEIANACNWHAPVIAGAIGRANSGQTVGQLAAEPASFWQGISSPPPAGTTALEFGKLIESQLAKRAYTAHIRARATVGTVEKVFLDANPTFDFDKTRFSKWMKDFPLIADTLSAPTKTKLAAMDRLFRVTESWADMNALLVAEVVSSRDVLRKGKLAITSIVGSSIKAELIFKKACWTVGAAVSIASKWKNFSQIALPILTNQTVSAPALDSKIADWPTLFGSLDQCACEHCQSVLSPSAYLVDTLELLKKVPASTGTAQSALFARRPDLAKLALTCEHATTPLPAIDLVNEIMEVRLGTSWPTVQTANSVAKAEDLAAHPEMLFPVEHVQAYTALDAAVFPFEAPFHLWQAEARVYLDHLGVPRDKLIEMLAPSAGPDAATLTRERLRISPNFYNLLIATSEPATNPHLHWGLPALNFVTEIVKVPVFMNQTNLTFDEVRELTTTGVESLSITPSDTCTLSSMTLPDLGTSLVRHKFNQFLRLRTALGIAIADVGRVLEALRSITAGAPQLQEVAALHVLTKRLGVPHVVAASWYADVDRNDSWTASLYTRTFLMRSTFAPAYGAFVTLKSSTSTSLTYADAAPGILAALELSAYDLGLLIDSDASLRELGMPTSIIDGAAGMTRAGLSLLARIATFSRAVGLTVRELMTYARLTDPGVSGAGIIKDLLRPATPTDTLRFLDLLDRVRRVKLSVSVADYVIRHVATQESGLEPSAETVAQWESTIAEAVRKAAEETRNLTDEDAASSENGGASAFWELGRQILHPDELETLRLIIKGSLDGTAATDFITAREPVLGLAGTCINAIVNGASVGAFLESEIDRRAFVTRRFARYLKARSAVLSSTSELLGLSSDMVATMWGTIDTAADPNATRHGVMGWVVDLWIPLKAEDSKEYGAIPDDPAGERIAQLIRLHQAAYVLSATARESAEVAASVSSLEYWSLRVLRHTTSSTLLAAELEALVQEYERGWVRDRWGKTDLNGPLALHQYANTGSPTPDGAAALIADQNSFQKADVLSLLTQYNVSGAQLGSVRTLVRVFEGIELLRRMGCSASQAVGWTNVVATLPSSGNLESPSGNALLQAREIKAVARAKYDEASWAKTGRAIRDPLRDQQRRLLSRTLMGVLNLKTLNDLYDNLLIDVEMGPCVLTSRMVAAHGSVQSFVQRIQLNLESIPAVPGGPTVAPNKLLSRRWDWMHAYRVWEANRKVFLWPENWLDPELRLDRTPLFDELEAALRKGPLDEATVGHAYRQYLDGLADVANLEVVAMCRDGLTLYLFARTAAPHRYFHRTYKLGTFTPWRRVDLDIQGESLLPIVVNGILHLFWARLQERATATWTASIKKASSHKSAEHELAAHFTCAELRGGVWQVVASDTQGISLAFVGTEPHILRLTGKVVGLTVLVGLNTSALSGDKTVVGGVLIRHAEVSYDLGGRSFTSVSDGSVVWDLPEGETAHYQGYRGLKAHAEFSNEFQPVVTMPRESRLSLERPYEPADTGRFLWVGNPEVSYLFVGKSQQPSTKPASTPTSTVSNAQTSQIVSVAINILGPKVVGFTPLATHHNFVNEFRGRLAKWGINGLLSPRDLPSGTTPSQSLAQARSFSVGPSVDAIPSDVVDFTAGSAFGEYNWEVFFHGPFLIANRLSQEGKYAEARRWYHYIFDPTDGATVPTTSGASRYWKFLPFAENKSLADIQTELTTTATSQYGKDMYGWAMNASTQNMMNQIQLWRDDPFNPHAIAKMRILAYQKAIVMRYIDNLIAWGDRLFTQDTRESVNEATQLYILAQRLLGPKPVISRKATAPAVDSYGTLNNVDAFGNSLADIETIAPAPPQDWTLDTSGECESEPEVGTVIGSLKFCVPENETLLWKWDVVADRLFKIRNCQNIEGIERLLPLFEPPIDPALLVRARAANLDLKSVMFDLQVSAPPYRYAILMARAMEYAGAVTGLGASLLSALERDDGEELSRMRTGHELANLGWTRDIRKQQRDEAKAHIESAHGALSLARARLAYYSSREFTNGAERVALEKHRLAEANYEGALTYQTIATVARAIPEIAAGFASSFEMIGGAALAGGFSIAAQVEEAEASKKGRQAAQQSTMGGFHRRRDDWNFQAEQAEIEIEQLEKQLLAAEIRLAITEHDLGLVEQQRAQTTEVEDYYRTKFTNKELYGWMARELSISFSESYRIAFEMARHAERAFQRERGDTTQTFIKFGAWDGTRQGLLSGEKLASDLRRMDSAYHTQNKREHEIVKTISIAQLNPEAFMTLREGLASGAEFSLPEKLFDDDFPTHHLRRIKTVNITLQCSPGPYQSVSGSLQLLGSATRLSSTAGSATPETGIGHIATSTAQNDAGVFDLNFRDERYLPFEYRGAHWDGSGPQWRFKLTNGNEFPYDSIADLVLQLRYTAREGRSGAVSPTLEKRALIRVPQTHADAWVVYRETPATGVVVSTKPSLFPRGKTSAGQPRTAAVSKVKAFFKWSGSAGVLSLTGGGPSNNSSFVGGYNFFEWTIAGTDSTDWTFTTTGGTLSDLFVAFTYTIAAT